MNDLRKIELKQLSENITKHGISRVNQTINQENNQIMQIYEKKFVSAKKK